MCMSASALVCICVHVSMYAGVFAYICVCVCVSVHKNLYVSGVSIFSMYDIKSAKCKVF